MDGHPNKKTKTWHGNQYSDTRHYVILWLEKQLPLIGGDVINISSGNWEVPKKLLDFTKVKKYVTFDKKLYGDSKNNADVFGDVHCMPLEWDNKWDCVINNQALECYENPFVAFEEMYRILKPGGILLLDTPFNYRFFGKGTGLPEKKNPVKDYWRITRDGLELLAKKFSNVSIKGFGGTGEHDRFTYCMRAVK